jgi:phosphoribosylaminoimidazolecarboxamide formyltransferase/IMP cyclohydrolase
MSNIKIKRALVSVSNKEGLKDLAKVLKSQDVEIISSGGTGNYLTECGIPWTSVEKVSGNPEAFGGRMKTLSFQVSSALLFRRDHQEDLAQAKKLNIEPIDMVICNLYPFVETAKNTDDLTELIEKIDIGGPTMVRAAAKNYQHVTCCVQPSDYTLIINELTTNNGQTSLSLRERLALKAFKHTANYDAAIAVTLNKQLNDKLENTSLTIDLAQGEELRYGENPHQWAKVIKDSLTSIGLAHVRPIQGKALSYNNYLDGDAAYRCTCDLNSLFNNKAVVTIIKHANPCGVSVNDSTEQALKDAWAGDPISAFGSIICFNREVSGECADFLTDKFVEVIIASSFTEQALNKFAKKKNLRLIQLPMKEIKNEVMVRSITGGHVVQNEDQYIDREFQLVTKNTAVVEDWSLLTFGTIVTKHLKSNAISLVRNTGDGHMLAGAGMGNPNRLISTKQAIDKASENKIAASECFLVSDAFFPFPDNVELATEHGIKLIVQPGGSIKDQAVIDACNAHDVSMCFTGHRHFRH